MGQRIDHPNVNQYVVTASEPVRKSKPKKAEPVVQVEAPVDASLGAEVPAASAPKTPKPESEKSDGDDSAHP